MGNRPGKRRKVEVGQKFSRLTTIKRVYDKHGKFNRWICKCDCGNNTEVYSSGLLSGKTRSCGCLQQELNRNQLERKKFGRLEAVNPTDKRVRNCIVWECKCDCGNIAEVPSNQLVRGSTMSCGCLNKELARRAIEDVHHVLHEKLRSATMDTPSSSKSKLGIRNIFYRENMGIYVVDIRRNKKMYRQEGFKTLEEALEVKKIVLDRYLSGDPEWYRKE